MLASILILTYSLSTDECLEKRNSGTLQDWQSYIKTNPISFGIKDSRNLY